MIEKDKLGVTLSGGGFRGVAHLGILQYMQELGLEIDAVSGASAGALVGAFIAQGYTPAEILRFAQKERFFRYSDILGLNSGLSTEIFEKIIRKYIPHDSFEGLQIPLYVSVTDMTNAQSLIFNQGCLSFAVKASCSFPMVFQPVLYGDDVYLCDGGLLNNFPVQPIMDCCTRTIGINVNPINKHEGKFSYTEIVNRIIRIATSRATLDGKVALDVYIKPEELSRYNTFDMRKIDELYQLGYDHALRFEKEFLILKKNRTK
ncbi:patatin-like phospholipase family protein [Mangrovibacterium marinum]|uniref:patatin-like phospholipase family protein n=1 Tax=Mangrovibacterium marinum TaxID=1639118 RepID=UPI002A18A807|nr:patatin-like phospholipase family protein [Mangrovibacterium marinum]